MDRVGSNWTWIPVYDLTRANGFADLRALPWEPVQDLLIEFRDKEIQEEIGEFEIANPAILGESFTRDPSVGERMPDDLHRNIDICRLH